MPAAASPSGQGYFYELLHHFGVGDSTAHTLQVLVVRPLEVLFIALIAWAVASVGARGARRAVRRVQNRAVRRGDSHRTAPRVATIGSVAASIWKVVVWIVAGLIALGTLGVNLTPLIAGATVIGAALGFGAQSLVRDFLAGFFIVVEDQYGVGDTVTIGDTRGVVEDLTLRVTRLRSVDGMVWYVPNGEVRKAGNASIQWSRALVDVVLPLGADVAEATELISEEASALATDEHWAPLCLEPPEVWGVHAMDSAGITVRVAVKVPPLQDSPIATALRGRITERLLQEGILSPS